MEVNLKFRRAGESDIPFLLALRRETMEPHIISAGLVPTEKTHLERIMYRFDCANIINCNSYEIGLLKVIKEGSVWDLVQIQIGSSFRGLGIGECIIKEILAEAFSVKAAIKLSVFKGNPAKKLYENLGFKIFLETETTYEMQADV